MKKIIKEAVEEILKNGISGKEKWRMTNIDVGATQVTLVREKGNPCYAMVDISWSGAAINSDSRSSVLFSQEELKVFAEVSEKLKAIREDDNTAYQIASQRVGRLCAGVWTARDLMDALDNLPPTIRIDLAGYRNVRFCIVRTIDHMYNLTLIRGDADPDEYGTTLDVVKGDTMIELLNGRAGKSYVKLHTEGRYEEECLPLQFRFVPLCGGESRPLVISYDTSLIEEEDDE